MDAHASEALTGRQNERLLRLALGLTSPFLVAEVTGSILT